MTVSVREILEVRIKTLEKLFDKRCNDWDDFKEKIDTEIRTLERFKAVLDSKAERSTVVLNTILAILGIIMGLFNIILIRLPQ
jgi:hypothetical protein